MTGAATMRHILTPCAPKIPPLRTTLAGSNVEDGGIHFKFYRPQITSHHILRAISVRYGVRFSQNRRKKEHLYTLCHLERKVKCNMF